jgi:hypothetical protein
MIATTDLPVRPGPARRNAFVFEAEDVTGTHTLEPDDVDPSTPVGSVARVLAARMELPQNVPWALRDNRSGSYLDDDVPIGDQVETGAQLVITPRTHLG